MKKWCGCFLFCFWLGSLEAQKDMGPKVLVVTAHPDDETIFSVTIYKITHDLKGIVDLAILTDGQGGFGNPELASQYYGINLNDTATARTYLPAIRKRELMNAGKITGIRNFFFFDQPDDYYSKNPKPYIGGINWDAPMIAKKLDLIFNHTTYDFVLVLLPTPDQHGHHQSAGLFALGAVKRIASKNKPVVLGGLDISKSDLTSFQFDGLKDFPESRLRKGAPVFTFDVAARFGNEKKISYGIVKDWTIAEYKSQGDLQNNFIHHGGLEAFWYFDLNGEEGLPKVQHLFDQLHSSGYATPASQ